jgi:hypothetical protein
MATPKIIPRAAGGGSLGADAWGWGGAYVTNITTSSATEGGKLVLAADDGAVMADNHRLGVIEFKGAEDTSNTLSIGARIQAIARDAWDGSNNDADLQFYTTDGTTESMALKLDADNLATFMGAVSIDNVAISAIQSSAEAFADNDTSLMTSASIQDKILAYGYTTATGDMTGVSITGGTNLTTASETNTTSGDYSVTLNVDDAFLVNDANDTTTGTITAAGFTTTGIVDAAIRKFTPTGTTTDGTVTGGDVVYFGGTTSMTAGAIYHYKSDGTWELADADAVATSDGLLAVALGAASDTNGMLLRGMVTIDHDPGAIGDVLFLSTTAGDCSATAPSGSADIVRVIGYQVNHASNGEIWFCPDGTYVELA